MKKLDPCNSNKGKPPPFLPNNFLETLKGTTASL